MTTKTTYGDMSFFMKVASIGGFIALLLMGGAFAVGFIQGILLSL